MSYKALELNIEKLLNENQSYHIPRYQRGYVWGEKNWEDIMRDIISGYRNEIDYRHFLGTFVFEEVLIPSTEEINYINIIDGQQRLTTIHVIVFSMIFLMKQYLKNSQSVISDSEFNEVSKRISVLQKYVYYTDRTTLEDKLKLLNESDTFNKIANLSVKNINNIADIDITEYEQLAVDPIGKAFRYLVSYLRNNVINDQAFLKDIIDFQIAFFKVSCITVSTSNQQEVLNLFEVLNARGLYLKQTELLKNFIFRNLPKDTLRDSVKIDWEIMNNSFYTADIDTDDYLFHFMRSYYEIKGLKKENIYQCLKEEEFKKDNKRIPQLYQNIRGYYIEYINIAIAKSETEFEKYVFEYFSLKNNKQIRSLLFSLRVKKINQVISDSQYKDLIKRVLCYFVGFNIAQQRSNQIDAYVTESSYSVFWSTSFAEVNLSILRFLNKVSKYYPTDSDLTARISSTTYSNKNRRGNIKSGLLIYYFKQLYNKARVEKDIEIPFQKLNVEHILPDNDIYDYTWKLGNLLLLTKKLNNSLKNADYNVKREKYLNSDLNFIREFAKKVRQFY